MLLIVSVTNKEIHETVSRPTGSEASVYTTKASSCSNSHPPFDLTPLSLTCITFHFILWIFISPISIAITARAKITSKH